MEVIKNMKVSRTKIINYSVTNNVNSFLISLAMSGVLFWISTMSSPELSYLAIASPVLIQMSIVMVVNILASLTYRDIDIDGDDAETSVNVTFTTKPEE